MRRPSPEPLHPRIAFLQICGEEKGRLEGALSCNPLYVAADPQLHSPMGQRNPGGIYGESAPAIACKRRDGAISFDPSKGNVLDVGFALAEVGGCIEIRGTDPVAFT